MARHQRFSAGVVGGAGYGQQRPRPRHQRPRRAANIGGAAIGQGAGALPGVGTVHPGAVAQQQPQAGQPGVPAQLVPDAQFLAAQAQQQFARQQQMSQLQQASTQDQQDTSEAIRRLLQGVPDSRSNIKTGASREGLLYSGTLGKRLDDFQSGVTRQQGDYTTQLQHREDARIAARKALEQGATIDDAALYAELATRSVGNDQTDASLGALAPPPAAPAGGTPRGPRTSRGTRPSHRRPRAGRVGHGGYGAGARRLLA